MVTHALRLCVFLVLCVGIISVADEPLVIDSNLPIFQVDDKLWRGPIPKTENDIRLLTSKGIKHIIAFLDSDELLEYKFDNEKTWAHKHGIHVTLIPASDKYPPNLSHYYRFRDIINRLEHPVYVHCRYGADRTGIIVLLHKVQNGESFKMARDDMMAHGFHTKWAWWWLPKVKQMADEVHSD